LKISDLKFKVQIGYRQGANRG